jgi:hypothetical protein
MANLRNGRDQADSVRRLRVDDMAAIVARHTRGAGDPATALTGPVGHSGRRFVVVAGVIVLLIWGTLYLVFREWRVKYRERAQYGATEVVPVIDPLKGVMPPGVDIKEWRDAVDQTGNLLKTVTGSNLLTKPDMVELKIELTQQVRLGCRRPAHAVESLAEIWNNVADRGEFLLRDSRSLSGDRHPRPRILPAYGATRIAPVLNPLRLIAPAGVDPGEWRDAIDQTRTLLIAVTDSTTFSVKSMHSLRNELEKRVDRASQNPRGAVDELAEIWNELHARLELLRPEALSPKADPYPRPEILPPRGRG